MRTHAATVERSRAIPRSKSAPGAPSREHGFARTTSSACESSLVAKAAASDVKGEGGGSFQGSSGGGYDNSFGSSGGGSRPMEGPKEDFSNADLDDEIPF